MKKQLLLTLFLICFLFTGCSSVKPAKDSKAEKSEITVTKNKPADVQKVLAEAAQSQPKRYSNQDYYAENKQQLAPTTNSELLPVLTNYSWFNDSQILTLLTDGTVIATSFQDEHVQQENFGTYRYLASGHLALDVTLKASFRGSTKNIIHCYEFQISQTSTGLQLTDISGNLPNPTVMWQAVKKVEVQTQKN